MAQYLSLTGDNERAVHYARGVLAEVDALGDPRIEAETNMYLGRAYYALGDFPRAMEPLRRNISRMVGDRLYERFVGLPSVGSRTWLTWCLAQLGDFAEGLVCGEEALRIARAADHPYSLIFACFGLGLLHLNRGEPEPAMTVLVEARELCGARDVRLLVPFVAAELGYAHVLMGRAANGLPLLEESLHQATSMGMAFCSSLRLAWLAEAYVALDRASEALELAARALDLSRAHKERGHEAWVLWLLGNLAMHPERRDADAATTQYRQALSLAGQLGMRPLAARCRLALGRLYA